MALITEYRTPATPDYEAVEVADADAVEQDHEALKAARSRVVAGSGRQLYLQSLQRDIDVEVIIRVWDTSQPPPASAEGTVPVTLNSPSGTLVIKQFTYGPAGEMALPCPGLYEGLASWNGRQETADYYDACLDRSVDEEWGAEQFRQAWRECPTREQYVIDLWPAHDVSGATVSNADQADTMLDPARRDRIAFG
ncbi:hypothetical protein [Streptomyces sp. XD-27]|uniref:hypothetical protein n=1 Tax=Streptomyces sp. XD-27 TaxID=3062779 RepID=UPI0026F431D9|nr:hypothetical protein [Streptomyces sp. XD-27]WKX70368.1 hypothetical protein Q3Y56_10960 [Streptomyces sp. XD-27]